MSLTKESVICALLLALCCGNLSAKEPTGFIFTGNKVINASNEKEFVLLNEKLPIAELKKRFSGYKIVATAGEDCSFCASISGRNGSFEIDYDEDGLVITGILAIAVIFLNSEIGTFLTIIYGIGLLIFTWVANSW